MADEIKPGLMRRIRHGWKVGLVERDGFVLVGTLVLAVEIFLILYGVPRI